MFVQIQMVSDHQAAEKLMDHREAMGALSQQIHASSLWNRADALHHAYTIRRITLDLAQFRLTAEQMNWLKGQDLISHWWTSYDREGSDRMPHNEEYK